MKKQFGHLTVPFKRIHIELTNVCDFNCAFCPKPLMTRPYGYMDTGLAKRLISEIKEHGLAEKITFHVMGEPTLHRDFFEILAHAQAEGQPVGLTTNAGGLGRAVGQELLKYGLKQLDVSLQTPDRESFALRRAGGLKFEDYLEGIMSFFAKYRARWADTVFKFRFLNTTFAPKSVEKVAGPIKVISSTAELRRTFAYWAQRIFEIMNTDQSLRDRVIDRIQGLVSWKWQVAEVLPGIFFETYMLADWGHAFTDEPVLDAWAGYCFGMRDHFAVLHNGDVILCCVDFDGKTAFGNLRDSTLKEVLSGQELGEIMDGFRRFKPILPYCKRCLGSRTRTGWLLKPLAEIAGLRLLKPYFYRKIKLYV
ncbi:MAG: radical SAM protein [Desulfovibrionaceae bacterium]|nr:radical SAM protein [Desulfovibrionaceae bacterium]